MKELSIAEKATRYDEAYKKVAVRFGSNVADEIFLKESEDGRIRKKVIDVLKLNIRGAESQMQASRGVDRTFEVYACNKAIAWLEKQGEPTEINPSEFDSQLNRLLKQFESLSKEELASSLSFYLNVVQNDGTYKSDEKQGEQKPADSKIIDLDELVIELEETIGTSPHSRETIKDFFQRAVQKYMNCLRIANGEISRLVDENYLLKEKQGEQKPAWSEENEINLGDALWAIQQARTIAKNENDMSNLWYAERWLKSLKDRVQPQPKQEWSEEDEEMYKEVLTDIIYAKNNLEAKECLGLSKRAMEAFNWFSKRYKSLRPQNHWKPSDEQVNTLEQWLKDNQYKGDARYCYPIFESLYQDLKKLREE